MGGASVGPSFGPVIETGAAASAFPELEEDMEPIEAEDERQEEDVEGETDPPLNRNILQESMLRFLNKRIYSDDPPVKIDARMEAYIPYLSSTQEAANLIHHIEENIQLTEMQADAARRTANLKYLKKANRAKRCQHVKLDGGTCGSPSLRGQQYCHFHAQAHGASMEFPVIEDQRSLQLGYMKLAQQVAANKIDPEQARILLQVLKSAGRNLPKSGSMVRRRFPGT
jgi:hypothetical protein